MSRLSHVLICNKQFICTLWQFWTLQTLDYEGEVISLFFWFYVWCVWLCLVFLAFLSSRQPSQIVFLRDLETFLTAPIVPLPPVDHSSSAYLDQSNNSSLGIRALPRGHDSCVPVMPEIRMRCQRWDTAMRQYGESLPESVRHELSSPIWDWRKVRAWGFPHLQIGQW